MRVGLFRRLLLADEVADRDAVALLLPDFLVKCELDVSLTVDDIELDARVFPHIVAQELSVTPQGGVVA